MTARCQNEPITTGGGSPFSTPLPGSEDHSKRNVRPMSEISKYPTDEIHHNASRCRQVNPAASSDSRSADGVLTLEIVSCAAQALAADGRLTNAKAFCRLRQRWALAQATAAFMRRNGAGCEWKRISTQREGSRSERFCAASFSIAVQNAFTEPRVFHA